MKTFEQLAQEGYEAYEKQAAAHAMRAARQINDFRDRPPIPAWTSLHSAEQACWVAATKQILSAYAVVH